MAVYPLMMVVAVLVTANHWLLDAVGGVLVVALAHAATTMLERPIALARATAAAA